MSPVPFHETFLLKPGYFIFRRILEYHGKVEKRLTLPIFFGGLWRTVDLRGPTNSKGIFKPLRFLGQGLGLDFLDMWKRWVGYPKENVFFPNGHRHRQLVEVHASRVLPAPGRHAPPLSSKKRQRGSKGDVAGGVSRGLTKKPTESTRVLQLKQSRGAFREKAEKVAEHKQAIVICKAARQALKSLVSKRRRTGAGNCVR